MLRVYFFNVHKRVEPDSSGLIVLASNLIRCVRSALTHTLGYNTPINLHLLPAPLRSPHENPRPHTA